MVRFLNCSSYNSEDMNPPLQVTSYVYRVHEIICLYLEYHLQASFSWHYLLQNVECAVQPCAVPIVEAFAIIVLVDHLRL